MRLARSSFLAILGLVGIGCVDNQITAAATKVAVNPELLDLGIVAPGATTTGTVSVSSVGMGALTLASLTVSGNDADLFTVADDLGGTVLPKGDSLDVVVSFTPLIVGAWEADLTVQTDANTGEAAAVVHLRGIGASPGLVVAPGSIDFGHVELGADVFQTVTLQCVSAVAATITGAELSGDATFYLIPVTTPAVVVSGGSFELTVGFGPTDALPQTGVLRLLTDVPDLPVVLVPVAANVCLGDGAVDADGDGYAGCAGDCDDTEASVLPGATEIEDGLDNDCDGAVDNGTEAYDDDGDGTSEREGDCNDADVDVSPAGTEDVDGVDDDCDGTVDDGTDAYDDDGDGFTERGGDCDDAAASSSPGAPEVADGVDNDCDGTLDEGTSAGDDDGDGYDEAAGDCDDTDSGVSPAGTETADGVDDDCDGTVDEGTTAYDDDGDGYTEAGGDCNDTTSSIGPHRLEVSGDGIDNDCNGTAS